MSDYIPPGTKPTLASKEQLLPCPFCGQTSASKVVGGVMDDYTWVECICGASGPESSSPETSAALWNKRAAPETSAFRCKANRTADPPQDCDWPHCGCDPKADKVLEALSEEGVLDDAARYRYLRQPGNAIVYAKDRNAWGQNASGHVRYDTAEQLDAAIDAARGAQKAAAAPWTMGGNLVGTHLQGYARFPYSRIVEVFGEPQHLGEDGDKVAFEWTITFADGTIASIYDYKASSLYGDGDDAPTPEEMKKSFTDWHIGGKSQRAVELVTNALNGL